MFMTDLKDVFYEWQHNIKFRESFKQNPLQALQEAGFELSPEDLTKILAKLALDKSKDDKLDTRESK